MNDVNDAVMSIIQKAQAAVPEMKGPVVDMAKFESDLEPFRERTKEGLQKVSEAVGSL